ncbi:MAG TPA: tRNA pseudouridine(55) synthase TruB [Thermomicrobiales bacterium]|jgi:tRNA pseudouridine55 synthase|nr:tRNA pseudouridine(55) synthase TruB [Thermomicrobiales bacterium]
MSRGRRAGAGRLHGILVIDKPAGWTSHDVVGRVRRISGEKRVGHAGTLDPAATGVLPVLVGDATKVVEFLSDAPKAYRAEITLGLETDSYDGDGVVTSVYGGTLPDASVIAAALDAFRGPIEQVPPMHSAIQINGQRLYELARRGETIERETRSVIIHDLEVVAWNEPVLILDITCSKGTYIRSIAHDLGRALGCGGYLSDLVRTRTGPFTLDDCWTLDNLVELFGEGPADVWTDVAVHPDEIVRDWPALVVSGDGLDDWSHGRPLAIPESDDARLRVYDPDGGWLGIGRSSDGKLQPWKVVRGTDG